MIHTLAAYMHTIDPYAIKLWEGGPIRWYGLAYLGGFIASYFLVKWIVKKGHSPLKLNQVADIVAAVAIGLFIGGRLGYVLLYQPSLLWTFTDQLPFWGVLQINVGGMASHGGIVGAILGCAYFARKHKIPMTHLLDLAAFTCPAGFFFGRLANFVNGELFGRPCDPALPWAVKFPQEIGEQSFDWNQLQPVINHLPPVLPSEDPGLYTRIMIAVQNGNQQVIENLAPLLTARHPSQLYAAILEGIVVFVVLAIFWRKTRKPGLVGTAYLMTYAVTRFIGEFFRMPDEHIRSQEFAMLHISRGQLLSIVLFMVGLTIAIIFSRRNVEKLGGWR